MPVYNDCSLPARLFYKILDTGDISLLGGKDYEKNWEKVFDEYYLLKDDAGLKAMFNRKKKIAYLGMRLTVARNTLMILENFHFLTDEHRKKLLNGLQEIGVRISSKSNIKEVLSIQIGTWETTLKIEMDRAKEGKSNTSFEKMLVSIENVIGRSIEENVSLRKFIAYEKSAKEMSAARK